MKLRSLTTIYTNSPQWMELASSSRRIYLQGIDTLAPLMEMDVKKIKRPEVIAFVDSVWHKRGLCRIAIQVLNNILAYGYDRGLCEYNHAQAIKHQPKADPIPRWTDEECGNFITNCPDYLRLAFVLALYTGQRRSDLIRMRWDQYDGKTIKLVQQKTKRMLTIPVHPQLREELEAVKGKPVMIQMGKKRAMTSPYILHNSNGQPFSAVGLSAAVWHRARGLGITGKSIHGLRKTAGSTLAEVGCSPHLIGSILGHKTLKELTRYTEEADQQRMATEAMGKWADASAMA